MMKRMITVAVMVLFIAGFSPSVSYCEEQAGQVPEVAVQMPAAEEPQEEGYVYEPRGRRDPFVPLVVTSRRDTGKKKSPRVLGTLESYDIPDFKLLAVVEKGRGEYSALILSPDNKSFVIREGTVIGLNNGKVTEISGDGVVVSEPIKDFKGETISRKVVLELYEGGVK